jgi:hypothetical protein
MAFGLHGWHPVGVSVCVCMMSAEGGSKCGGSGDGREGGGGHQERVGAGWGVWTRGEEKIYHSPAQEANGFCE